LGAPKSHDPYLIPRTAITENVDNAHLLEVDGLTRALRWQRRGQGFESPTLYHTRAFEHPRWVFEGSFRFRPDDSSVGCGTIRWTLTRRCL
jgi:hypothetical protein